MGSRAAIVDNTQLIGLIERTLTSLDIPSGTTQIGDGALSGFTSLISVTIPDTVTKILSSGIRECKNLETLDLPASIESIGNFAFYSNFKLGTIICRRQTPPSLGSSVFGNGSSTYVGKNVTGTKKLYVPYGCTSAYQTGKWLNELLDSSKCNFTIAELDQNGNIPE